MLQLSTFSSPFNLHFLSIHLLQCGFNYMSQQLLIIKNPQSINTPAAWSVAGDAMTSGAASSPGGIFGQKGFH